MKIDLFDMLRDLNPRVMLSHRFLEKLRPLVSVTKTAREIKIHPKTLERKLCEQIGNSFKLSELAYITSKYNIPIDEIYVNIDKIKIGKNAYWTRISRFFLIDENFIEGVGFYIGDGRTKTNRGLSAINTNPEVLKFFSKWLTKNFGIMANEIKVYIYLPTKNFDAEEVKERWKELLEANGASIYVKEKYGGKAHHKTEVEICCFRSIYKLIFDKVVPIVKKECLRNPQSATAYLKGIFAAEGSVKNDEKSHSKNIHLKMKDKGEVEYVKKLLESVGFRPTLVYSKLDDEWVTIISGMEELELASKLNIFGSHLERAEKLKSVVQKQKHRQVKKGRVAEFYVKNLFEFEKKFQRGATAPELAEIIGRDRTRVVAVLRMLQDQEYIQAKRIRKTGSPFEFSLTSAGKNLIADQITLPPSSNRILCSNKLYNTSKS